MFNEKNDTNQIKINTAALLMLVAQADEKIEDAEILSIKEILIDFFNIDSNESDKLILDSQKLINTSTDVYQIGSIVKDSLSSQDLIDLLCCIFEVAYADKNLHFMERHIINQIANILNINKSKILDINKEMKNILL